MKTALTYIFTAVWLISPLQIHEITAASPAQEQHKDSQVEVEDFELTLTSDGDVLIEWTSTEEIDNYSWTVEYREFRQGWKVVATIAGAGISNTDVYYKVRHTVNQTYTKSYRLLDGAGKIIVGDDMDI